MAMRFAEAAVAITPDSIRADFLQLAGDRKRESRPLLMMDCEPLDGAEMARGRLATTRVFSIRGVVFG
jgi:hypothetical protein